MNTLQEIVPNVFIPHVPRLRPPPSTPSTGGYAPLTAPPEQCVPYWILHSPTLANSMMEELHRYLAAALGGSMPPSSGLQVAVDGLPDDLLDTTSGELSSQKTTSQLWDLCFLQIIRPAVKEVDQHPTQPRSVVRRTLYSQIPDTLFCPVAGTLPCLHREDKSWAVFDTNAPDILALAQHVEGGRLGTSLVLGTNETGARSIIMKMGVSMISGPNLIPYGILFGGHKFMLFSLFRNQDALGEVRYGLACSNIIDSTNTTTPLIPLVIYTLLGNTNGPAPLHQTAFTIPPTPTPVIEKSTPVTQSISEIRFGNSTINLIDVFKKKLTIHTHTLGGAVSRSFVLYREADTFKSVASPVRSSRPLVASFTRRLAAYVETTRSFFTPSQTPPSEQIKQAIEDPLASNASLVPSDQMDCEISLAECIGHGAAGQVFIGTAGNEKYAVKIAPWKGGQPMLRREADIYKVLSDLQGRCIPKVYGFFGSEHLKVLIMAYMGRSVENISDLNVDQRRQLLEELCLIHQRGVVHGDLHEPNIVLQNGSAHFIDFSHGYEHRCTGPTSCFELKGARLFLLLT